MNTSSQVRGVAPVRPNKLGLQSLSWCGCFFHSRRLAYHLRNTCTKIRSKRPLKTPTKDAHKEYLAGWQAREPRRRGLWSAADSAKHPAAIGLSRSTSDL